MSVLARKRILLTAGPTREPMDPVRYLTNASSGQMGLILAEELKKKGFYPTVILGPTHLKIPRSLRVRSVITAQEMQQAVFREIKQAAVFIATAAVSDFRFSKTSPRKLKKGSQAKMSLTLVRTPDILKEVGLWKKKTQRERPLLIGYALETHNLRRSMAQKMKEKKLDLVIGNSPDSLGSEEIQPSWLERDGVFRTFHRMTKRALARKIAQWVRSRLP